MSKKEEDEQKRVGKHVLAPEEYQTSMSELERAYNCLQTYGVAVVTDAVPQPQKLATRIREEMHRVLSASSGNAHTSLESRFDTTTDHKRKQLPPHEGRGHFQHVFCNMKSVWDVRTHARVRDIFDYVQRRADETMNVKRRRDPVDLVTSIEGIHVFPAHMFKEHPPPMLLDKPRIHARGGHVMHTIRGRVVLAGARSGFRCSPKSHLCREALHERKCTHVFEPSCSKSATLKVYDHPTARAVVERRGGCWQQTICAPPGSMILWLGSTVQSNDVTVSTEEDTWRVAVDVTHTPLHRLLSLVSSKERVIKRYHKAVRENRCTNHSVERLVPTLQFPCHGEYTDAIRQLMVHPQMVYVQEEASSPNAFLNAKQRTLTLLPKENRVRRKRDRDDESRSCQRSVDAPDQDYPRWSWGTCKRVRKLPRRSGRVLTARVMDFDA